MVNDGRKQPQNRVYRKNDFTYNTDILRDTALHYPLSPSSDTEQIEKYTKQLNYDGEFRAFRNQEDDEFQYTNFPGMIVTIKKDEHIVLESPDPEFIVDHRCPKSEKTHRLSLNNVCCV
ncbi:unnamed protein product [Trichobilharzia regenti]|nr:unnamed protein product [Trichobilharzia regenti]